MFQHCGVLSNLSSQFVMLADDAGIERDRRQAHRLVGLRIDEARAALRAVIEAAEVAAIEADAVDHAGLEVGDQELLVPAVIGDVAERGAGVLPLVQRIDGEQHRLVAVGGVELVDRAGTAAAEHAGHPLRLSAGTVQAERGGGGDVDVRGIGIVERHAEHLADFAGGDRIALRLVDPVLALRRLARVAQIEDAADSAVECRSCGSHRHPGAVPEKRVAKASPGCRPCARLGAAVSDSSSKAVAPNSFVRRLVRWLDTMVADIGVPLPLEFCFCPTTTTSGQPGCDAQHSLVARL